MTTFSKRLLRITDIIAPDGPIPVGKSTWWEGVKEGRFPQPIKLGPRITVWRAVDIEKLLEHGPCHDTRLSTAAEGEGDV